MQNAAASVGMLGLLDRCVRRPWWRHSRARMGDGGREVRWTQASGRSTVGTLPVRVLPSRSTILMVASLILCWPFSFASSSSASRLASRSFLSAASFSAFISISAACICGEWVWRAKKRSRCMYEK